jgi:uncharacterized protein YecE (DUF72 family)
MEQVESLEDFLMSVPRNYRVAVEVRNKDLLNDEVFSLLKRRSAAFVWVDGGVMPDVEVVTSDFVYVRWEGDRRKVNGLLGRVENNRSDNITSWADRIRPLLKGSLDVFGYFSKYYSGYPPTDAEQLFRLI